MYDKIFDELSVRLKSFEGKPIIKMCTRREIKDIVDQYLNELNREYEIDIMNFTIEMNTKTGICDVTFDAPRYIRQISSTFTMKLPNKDNY